MPSTLTTPEVRPSWVRVNNLYEFTPGWDCQVSPTEWASRTFAAITGVTRLPVPNAVGAGFGADRTARTTAAATAATTSTAAITTHRDRIGRCTKAASRLTRLGSGIGDTGPVGVASGGSGLPTTRNASRDWPPRRNGLRVRTSTAADPDFPIARSTTSGLIRKPSFSSGSAADRYSRAGAFPQFPSSTRCRPRHRPDDVAGVILACSPAIWPISRSPSTTADAPDGTVDTARTAKGTAPLIEAVPPGGEIMISAEPSCPG